MVDVLADTDLCSFTGGVPPTIDQLRATYRALIEGPFGSDERWLNWIVVQRTDRRLIGFVQATITAELADIAWLIGVSHQGQGFATEAAGAMFDSLVGRGIKTVTAHIHPGHIASQHVATKIGMATSEMIDDDGETVWISG